jgi:hypothetical protein
MAGPRQKQVREYRGQIPSPGRPTGAWREDRVRFWATIATGVLTDEDGQRRAHIALTTRLDDGTITLSGTAVVALPEQPPATVR